MTMRLLPVAALAALVTACGPNAEQFEQSIIENYEGEGYTDVSVSLAPSEDGGFTGNVSYTNPETGRTEERECTVEPVEGDEVPWVCVPSVASMEQNITETYSQNGATNIRPQLTKESAERYTGTVDFQIPGLEETIRHNCTVDLSSGEQATWNCVPPGGDPAAANPAAAPAADAAPADNVKG